MDTWDQAGAMLNADGKEVLFGDSCLGENKIPLEKVGEVCFIPLEQNELQKIAEEKGASLNA